MGARCDLEGNPRESLQGDGFFGIVFCSLEWCYPGFMKLAMY